MTFGLLIKDRQGRVVLDPDTFTVRLIATFEVPPGAWTVPVRFSIPLAAAGMFATASPKGQFQYQPNPLQYVSNSSRGPGPVGTRMPGFLVGDGFVELFPPMPGSGAGFDGNLLVYVFAYI